MTILTYPLRITAIRRFSAHAGFTLLELIGVMVITSFIAAIAGFGLLYYINDFVQIRRASQLQDDGRLVMTRMVKEISLATKILYGSTTVLEFNSIHDGTNQKLALWYDQANKFIFLSDGRQGTPTPPTWIRSLASGVESFQLLYYPSHEGPPKTIFFPNCMPPLSNRIVKYKYRFINALPYNSATDSTDKIEIEFYSAWPTVVDDFVIRYCDLEFPAHFHNAVYPPLTPSQQNPHWEYESEPNAPPGYCDKAYIYSVSMGIECYMDVVVPCVESPSGLPCSSLTAKISSPPSIPTISLIELSFTLTDANGARQDFVTRIAAQALQ